MSPFPNRRQIIIQYFIWKVPACPWRAIHMQKFALRNKHYVINRFAETTLTAQHDAMRLFRWLFSLMVITQRGRFFLISTWSIGFHLIYIKELIRQILVCMSPSVIYYIVTCMGLLYNPLLHFINHCHTHTSVYSCVFTSRCSVKSSNRGRSPYSGLPNSPCASFTIF
jgi:hypothetical protein